MDQSKEELDLLNFRAKLIAKKKQFIESYKSNTSACPI
jgi:putative SOS response-associated peptidase YedK